ncbi:MAG: LytTR family DNA-binding domain-containing protein [Bacteroidota bacterium]
MITYCIIDDEPIAHRIIEGYCENLPHLTKAANCYNAFEAMQLLAKTKVDLIFLDINMPKLSGFDLLKSLAQHPKVIVTSAYKEFALEGYELDVADYLLKPFSLDRFLKAINKVVDYPPATFTPSTPKENASFFLKGDKKMHQIHLGDILFIEAYGNYSKVFLAEECIVSHEKISSFDSLLSEGKFLRVHRSFIVSVERIETIEGNQILIRNHKIPIGQTYKRKVNSLWSRGL